MKLLFDENLSPKLAHSLSDLFPGSQHVFDSFPPGTDDIVVWEYATNQGFAIVSKDSDFTELSALRGGPTKVIRIRFGNCVTAEIATALRDNFGAVQSFLKQRHDFRLDLTRKRSTSRA